MESRNRRYRRYLAALLLAGLIAQARADAERYVIDASHTYPAFSIGHMGLSQLRGRFNKTEGWIELDRANKTGKVDVTIDVTSLDSGHPVRDRNLLKGVFGAGFFQAEQFPTMHYHAEKIRFDGDQPAAVEGELTLLGVTRPVVLTIQRFQCGFNTLRLANGCGAHATAQLKRTDFGMTGLTSWITDDVELAIDVEAYLPPSKPPSASK